MKIQGTYNSRINAVETAVKVQKPENSRKIVSETVNAKPEIKENYAANASAAAVAKAEKMTTYNESGSKVKASSEFTKGQAVDLSA